MPVGYKRRLGSTGNKIIDSILGVLIDPNELPMPAGNIMQLANSAEAAAQPELKKILDFMVKRYPRISKLVGTSKFTKDPVQTWGTTRQYGSYSPSLDASTTSLIRYDRLPTGIEPAERSVTDVMNTIGHEILGHGRDWAKASKKGMQGRQNFAKEILQEQSTIPYSQQPAEQRAREMGRKIIRALQQRGMLPDTIADWADRTRILAEE